MFSAQDLKAMRATQNAALPDLGTIKRVVRVDDGFGGTTKTSETTVATEVPCRVSQAQTQVMLGQADRQLRLEKWTVRVPVGTDLRAEDIFEWRGFRIEIDDVKARSWDTVITGMGEVVN